MAYRKVLDEVFIEGTIGTVAEIGIENTRTKQIAERAGFSEGTMFKKFPTKEILLRDTFLFIDKKISDIVVKSMLARSSDNRTLEDEMHEVWHKIYRYLIEHKEETLFLIRYRYSSYYTDEVREMMAFRNGSFDKVYELLKRKLGAIDVAFENLLVICAMEITVCFIEKIIYGKIEDDLDSELNIWMIVKETVQSWNRRREVMVS